MHTLISSVFERYLSQLEYDKRMARSKLQSVLEKPLRVFDTAVL